MKRNVHPAAAVAIVATILVVVVGLWFFQPFKPKVYGLEPPTAAQRHQQAEEMKQSMIQAAQARQQVRPPTGR